MARMVILIAGMVAIGLLLTADARPEGHYAEDTVAPLAEHLGSLQADTTSADLPVWTAGVLPPPVAFVGYEVVDLMWAQEAGDKGYRVLRDGSEISDTADSGVLPGWWFFRDKDLLLDHTYVYQICRLKDTTETCDPPGTVKTGEVRGMLFKDLAWDEVIPVNLAGDVLVMPGVELVIAGGASVHVWGHTLSDHGGQGTIRIDGSGGIRPELLGHGGTLCLCGPNSMVKDADLCAIRYLELCPQDTFVSWKYYHWTAKPDSVLITDSNLASLHTDVYSGSHVLQNNTLGNQTIGVNSGAEAVIVNNQFVGTLFDGQGGSPGIVIAQGGTATITGNTFKGEMLPEAISVRGGTASIKQNTFQAEIGGAVKVWSGHYGSNVEMHENTFGPGGTGAIVLGEDPTWDPLKHLKGKQLGKKSVVQVRNNRIAPGMPSLSATGTNTSLELTGNTMLDTAGLNVHLADSDILINDNCIVKSRVSLSTTRTVDASRNWWGASGGPYVYRPGEPGSEREGKGNEIWLMAGEVMTRPWLTKPNCPVEVTDLKALGIGIEPVQTTQTADNRVPLVENRWTVVRGYVECSVGELEGVTARLTVAREGEEPRTLHPSRAIRTVYNPTLYEGQGYSNVRAQRDRGFVFRLPTSWLTGRVTLTLTINPDAAIAESNYDNNTTTTTVELVRRPDLGVTMVPVSYSAQKLHAGSSPTLDSTLQLGDLFRKIYPSPQVTNSFLPTVDWPYELESPPDSILPGYPNSKNGAMLLNTLGIGQMRLEAEGAWGAGALGQVYASFPEGSISHERSEPTSEGGRGHVAYGRDEQVFFAQTLARNLGFPAQTCGIHTSEYGYDVATDEVIPPERLNVLCLSWPYPTDPDLYWIDPDGYQALLDYSASALIADGRPLAVQAPQTYLLVAGTVSGAGEVTFMPAWQITAPEPPENPPAGSAYCLELRDAGDAVLRSHCFDLAIPNEYEWRGFLVALPLTGNPARVVLRQGGSTLGEVPVSAHPPSVTISPSSSVQSVGQGLSLNWSGADGDGDALSYSVLYSPDDGASWLPVATNITPTQYTLNLSEVPGGAQAWVRVEVSDGFHTAADSFGPFVVDDHAPMVAIFHPEQGDVVSPTLTLSGYAYDLEDGELDGDALVWTSSLDGQLGNGRLLYATGLSTGTQKLTLAATDSQGKVGKASVTVGVDVGSAPPIGLKAYLPLVLR